MLDRLPPELLDHVFRLIQWPSFQGNERETTLAQCCLVDKRCHQYAQPMLWRDVHLDSDREVDFFATALCGEPGEHLEGLVRSMVLNCQEDWSAALEFLPWLSNLVELTLVCDVLTHEDPPLETFPELRGLKRLNLHNIQIGNFHPGSFPAVTTLYMANCIIIDSDGQPASYVLDAAAFPSLRTLSIRELGSTSSEGASPYKIIAPDILQQLDAFEVSLDWHSGDLPPDYPSPSLPAILEVGALDLACAREIDIAKAGLRRLHFAHQPQDVGNGTATVRAALLRLASLLPSSPPLLSLHLATSLRLPTNSDALSALVKACKERGTEVVWFDKEGEFLPIFAQYMRGVRARGRGEERQ
ncbi:hypothetical protein JCM10213_003432 [Rhodosporidiobolus nylandii]